MENEKGDSLVSVIVAASVLSVVATGALSLVSSSFKAARHGQLRGDVNALRRHLTESLDCAQTLAEGVDHGAVAFTAMGNLSAGPECDPAASTRKWLPLKDSRGNPLTAPLDLGSGPYQYSGALGEWRLVAQCDRVARTLVIRAARPGSAAEGGPFAEDPLTKRIYDFSPAGSLYLVGGSSSARLCQDQLGGGPAPLKLLGYSQSSVAPGTAFISEPAPGGTGTYGPIVLGSATYVPQGNRLFVNLRSQIGANGTGRAAYLSVGVTQNGASVGGRDPLFMIGGNAQGHTVAALFSGKFVVEVTPQVPVTVTLQLKSQEFGSSIYSPMAHYQGPSELFLEDYRQQ